MTPIRKIRLLLNIPTYTVSQQTSLSAYILHHVELGTLAVPDDLIYFYSKQINIKPEHLKLLISKNKGVIPLFITNFFDKYLSFVVFLKSYEQ